MAPPSSPSFDADRLDARDPAFIAMCLPLAKTLCDRYFRLAVEGSDHIPREGPVLYIANHNNGIAGPEIACAMTTLWETRDPHAPLYALAHDFAMRHFTPFGRVLQRFGGLRATPENGRRVLEQGGQLLVYPGGDLEAYRHSSRRNEIVLGKRSGFVRLAQQMKVPVVPIVAHGAHRSAWIVSEGEEIARRLRMKEWARLERFPIALSLPWGLTLGPWLPYLPLPWSVRLRFLPPVRIERDEDPASAREGFRVSMQRALHEMDRAS